MVGACLCVCSFQDTCAFCLFCVGLQVVFRDPVRYKLQKVLTVAAEGTYSGQVCCASGLPRFQACSVLQLQQRMERSFGSSSHFSAMQLQQQHSSSSAVDVRQSHSSCSTLPGDGVSPLTDANEVTCVFALGRCSPVVLAGQQQQHCSASAQLCLWLWLQQLIRQLLPACWPLRHSQEAAWIAQ